MWRLWFRRIAEFLAIVSLFVIMGGGWYVVVQQSGQLPQWIGNVLASFTGGMLALLGGYFTTILNRQTEKNRLEREQRLQQIEPYRKYLVSLYYLLYRKVFAEELSKSEVAFAEQIAPSDEELKDAVLGLPPLEKMSLLRDAQLRQKVEMAIHTGVELIFDKGDNYHDRLQKWSDECRMVLNQIDTYERSPL